MLVFLAGCARAAPDAEPAPAGSPVFGLHAVLEDEVRDLPGERIAWSTDWTLCWDPYPGATAYELQAVTSEGTSPKLRRQTDLCHRLQVATGENQRSRGLLHRDMHIASQAGQLAYQVRAALGDGRVSEWSAVAEVGEVTPP